MSWTNLSLGHNWPTGEWPEYVEVDHDDGRGDGPRRYVPERTCRIVEDEEGDSVCSECGADYLCMTDASYCPDCGARVRRKG